MSRIEQAERWQGASDHGFGEKRHLLFTFFALCGFARDGRHRRCGRFDENRLHRFGPLLFNCGFALLGDFLTDTAILPTFDRTATTAHGTLQEGTRTFEQHHPRQPTEHAPAEQHQRRHNQGGAGKTEELPDGRGQAVANHPTRAHGQTGPAGMKTQRGKGRERK